MCLELMKLAMTNKQAIDLARAYLGCGPSTFYSYYSKHFSTFRSGDWCACFVSCILSLAGASAPGFPGLYCPTLRNAGVNAGKAVAFGSAQPGDVVFFNWDNNKNADHVGLLETCNFNDKTVTTIDGNVSNKVGRRTRNWSEVMTIIRPTYAEKDTGLMNLVKAIQIFLQSKGYYQGCIVDGDFGTLTAKALQTYLRDLGYYTRAIDGDFGTYSRVALTKAFEKGRFC